MKFHIIKNVTLRAWSFSIHLIDSVGVETLRKKLGARVRQLRRDAGITQEDFAASCGFARSYMSRVERGTSNLSLDGIERLAIAFNIPVGELFKGL